MLRTYFEPNTLSALGEVLSESKAILKRTGEDTPLNLDLVARRILELASEGMPPWLILAEIMKPMTPADAGLKKTEIKIRPLDQA